MGVQIGDQNLVWAVADQTWGYIENLTREETPDMVEQMSGQGEVKAVEFFNQQEKISGTYVYMNVTGEPVKIVGTDTTITITDPWSLTFRVTSVSETAQQGQFLKVDFNGVYWPNLGS